MDTSKVELTWEQRYQNAEILTTAAEQQSKVWNNPEKSYYLIKNKIIKTKEEAEAARKAEGLSPEEVKMLAASLVPH